jgi:hypothetical protein
LLQLCSVMMSIENKDQASPETMWCGPYAVWALSALLCLVSRKDLPNSEHSSLPDFVNPPAL